MEVNDGYFQLQQTMHHIECVILSVQPIGIKYILTAVQWEWI